MMKKKKRRETSGVNASSMADIAFLLLIFFLVTTTIASDKGLAIILPPKKEDAPPVQVKMKERNIFKVLINSKDQLLVEGELIEVSQIRELAMKFISNKGVDEKSSESPEKAVVSLKADRGTSYEMYINVMDELKAAYHELRAQVLNITVEEYLQLDKKDANQNEMFERSQKEYPMQISEAEPTDIGG